MKEFEELIAMAKNMGGSRGALIQLEGRTVYLSNLKRTVMFKLEFSQEIGSGTFYVGEAVSTAETIKRRDNRVLFEWRERAKTKRILIPDKKGFKNQAEAVLEKYYTEPNVKVPVDFLDDLNRNILTSHIRVVGDKITTRQKRSDGTVMLENLVKLNRGLKESENHPDSGEVTVFTQDLFVLKGFVRNPLFMKIVEGNPVSIRGGLTFGAKFRGVISHLVYEV